MDILIVTVFVSLILVIAGVVLFVLRMRAGDFDHGERLSLLPLQEEDSSENQQDRARRADSDLES